jgi:S-adenosylmethionine:tRNA ribosyltransferase-isomerase
VRAATAARTEPASDRLLVVGDGIADHRVDELPALLGRGDLLVVNDAATLPASLRGRTRDGTEVEVRLLGMPAGEAWPALLFGSGDWRTQTEDRPRPPAVAAGDELRFADGLAATVVRVWPESPRLLDVRFDRAGAPLLAALYAQGRPVQYAYLPDPLTLRAFQTPFASRPWSAEMPSAGRVLTAVRLATLRRAGIGVASLTHAAGLSSTGEPALDALLPLPEPYDVPVRTAQALRETRARGGRVIAAGTTVVRALESAAERGAVEPGPGMARLRVDASHALRSVDAILTGMHEPGSSHFELLTAFASPDLLSRAHARADEAGYLAHEFGDSMLVFKMP